MRYLQALCLCILSRNVTSGSFFEKLYPKQINNESTIVNHDRRQNYAFDSESEYRTGNLKDVCRQDVRSDLFNALGE